jgi:N-acetylglucosaminyl-diphospho-decaprenol L-rhamnosyltransferase
MTDLPQLNIVIVDWNSGQLLRECLSSIRSSESKNFGLAQVVVVDNASDLRTVQPDEFTDLPLAWIRNSSNRGFAAACNQGAKFSEADYLLFLNPDVRLQPDSIRRAIDLMTDWTHRCVGICGIRHVDEGGSFSTSCARFPTLKTFFGKMTGLVRLMPRQFPPHFLTADECSQSREVDQVIGAFFMVRRLLFEDLGGFDERFFVYFEEVDFALRASRCGFTSYYLAEAVAIHHGGGCSGRIKGTRLFYSLRSRLFYAFKHYSTFESLLLLILTLTVEAGTRLLSAVASFSPLRVVETIAAYGALLSYFCSRGANDGGR